MSLLKERDIRDLNGVKNRLLLLSSLCLMSYELTKLQIWKLTSLSAGIFWLYQRLDPKNETSVPSLHFTRFSSLSRSLLGIWPQHPTAFHFHHPPPPSNSRFTQPHSISPYLSIYSLYLKTLPSVSISYPLSLLCWMLSEPVYPQKTSIVPNSNIFRSTPANWSICFKCWTF